MNHALLLLGAALATAGMVSGCTYNTYTPPEEIHVNHYDPAPATKSASVGGSSSTSSVEGFQAVTPPHSYSN